ncbi:MAG: hypothetical protein U9R75_12485, partial [Candidatus Thermoplasmatota archaeon]|nr:hypothetical protein [Candidatus Thermoplasmatota archaeon]
AYTIGERYYEAFDLNPRDVERKFFQIFKNLRGTDITSFKDMSLENIKRSRLSLPNIYLEKLDEVKNLVESVDDNMCPVCGETILFNREWGLYYCERKKGSNKGCNRVYRRGGE